MNNLEIIIQKDGDGLCELFDEMNEISMSVHPWALETFGQHYYFNWIQGSYDGKDFKNETTGDRRLLIRRPGRSCGWIEINEDDIIVNSLFYEEIDQDEDMMEIMKKHHGRKVVLNGKDGV